MFGKSILSRFFPAWYGRRMDAELKARRALLTSRPEGNLAIPKSRAVEDYYDTDIMNAVEKSEDPSWTNKHKVVAISFHKDYSSVSKHEYIVLRCSFPNDREDFYIRLERTHEPNPSPAPDSEAASREPSPSPKSFRRGRKTRKSSPLVSGLKKGGYGALDEFHYVLAEDFEGSTQLQQFQPRNLVTIVDVAVLACVLHDDSPRYELFRRQCFWYSYMVYEILREVFEAQDTSVEGLIPVSSKEHKSEKAFGRGKWVFPINNPDELLKDRKRLTSKFEEERAKARTKVDAIIQANLREKEQHRANERMAREQTSRSELLERENQMLRERLQALEAKA